MLFQSFYHGLQITLVIHQQLIVIFLVETIKTRHSLQGGLSVTTPSSFGRWRLHFQTHGDQCALLRALRVWHACDVSISFFQRNLVQPNLKHPLVQQDVFNHGQGVSFCPKVLLLNRLIIIWTPWRIHF